MIRILKATRKPTAIVAMSDIIAIGAMREAMERGLHLPEDLAFAGFLLDFETERSFAVFQRESFFGNHGAFDDAVNGAHFVSASCNASSPGVSGRLVMATSHASALRHRGAALADACD
jgi:hypothetical protein